MYVTKSSGGNGMICGSFYCNGYDSICFGLNRDEYFKNILSECCLTEEDLYKYAKYQICKSWKIIHPVLFTKPVNVPLGVNIPMSWTYLPDGSVLLSIRLKWFNLIVNGIKKRELRKSFPMNYSERKEKKNEKIC